MIPLTPKPERPQLESGVLAKARAELSGLPHMLVARNNSGALKDATGRLVRYGLGDGSADLIGCVSVALYARIIHPFPDGSGYSIESRKVRVGVYVAIEMKRPGKTATPEQRAWLDLYASRGAITGVAHSAEEALQIVHDGIAALGGVPWS